MDVNPMDPIEAYHPEYPSYGVHPAQYSFGPRGHRVRFNGGEHILEPNGHLPYSGWRIRNIQPVAAKPAISDELVDRMVALVREMASEGYDRASDIVAKLPQPVDPDLLEAREIACAEVPSWAAEQKRRCRQGTYDGNLLIVLALAGVRRGRSLERGEP